MKKTLMFVSALVLAVAHGWSRAEVGPGSDVIYNCLGKNADGESLSFELRFTSFQAGVGHFNQSIVFHKKGALTYSRPMVFQLFGATPINSCKKNAAGETFLATELNMAPTAAGDAAPYTLHLQIDCGSPETRIDARAYCFFAD